MHPCWPGFASGSHESVASKEIEDLDKLKDVKILLSGLLFGLSALARAPSRRKVSLPLQSPGYLLRCHPVDNQVNKVAKKTAEKWNTTRAYRFRGYL